MKLQKIILISLLAFLPISFVSSAIDDDIIDAQDITESAKQPGPFRLEFDGDWVQKASFEKKAFDGQHLTFSQFSGRAGMAFCYFPEHREAYAFAFGYVRTKIYWPENPFFDQTYFNTALMSLRLYSNRIPDWIWKGQITASIDINHPDFNHYLYWDWLMWGRYEWCEDVGLHIGFYAQTGMKMDRVFPIIGFDWQFCPKWKFALVYPTDIALTYDITKAWNAQVAMRFFDVRHRTGKNQPLPEALVNYRNAGLEFALNYHWDPYLEANVHVGSTMAGALRISNQHNHHPHTYSIKDSGYIGTEIVVSF